MTKSKFVLLALFVLSLTGAAASLSIIGKAARIRNPLYRARFGLCTVTTYTNWTTIQQAPWQSYWHTNEFYTYPVIGPCPYTYLYETE
jgi:hypothetical protein